MCMGRLTVEIEMISMAKYHVVGAISFSLGASGYPQDHEIFLEIYKGNVEQLMSGPKLLNPT